MSHANPQGLAEGLLRIHAVISRGVEVGRERTHANVNHEPIEDFDPSGFADYLHALVSVLHGHHTGEDQIVWPALRDRFPDAPWDLLAEEHRHVAPVLDEIDAQATAMGQAASAETWGRLAGALDRLGALWAAHSRREEEQFTPRAVDRLVPAEQQAELVAQMAAHGQQHTGPDYLVLPFMLFNLQGDSRDAMSSLFPPVVTEHLVPVAWRDKWAPMKPFLLA